MLRELSPRARELHERLVAFMDQWVYPNEVLHSAQVQADRWRPPPIVEELNDRSLRGMCLLHDRLGAGR
jgi:acyl-CoA dehydrogenase